MRVLFAVAGGILWGLCFSHESLSIASWCALAPLAAMLSWPKAGRLGWLHGLAAWMTGLYWIVPTLRTYGHIAVPLGIFLTGLLAGYLALFHGVFAWLGSKMWRRGGLIRLLTLPALWVSLEWVRTYLGGGFPWNLAGYAWVDVPGALPLSAFLGAYGLSFLVVLTSVALAAAVLERRWEPAVVGLMIPLLLLPLAARWSLREMAREIGEAGGFGKPVRLLQPNIPNLVAYDPVMVARNYRKVLDQSREACQPGSLVVWPESAAWPFEFHRDPWFDQDLQAMVERGCTVIFNSGTPVGKSFYNSAFLLSPSQPSTASQPIPRYDKRHLVPFGEYVPFRGVFGWMDKLARDAGEFRPADETVLLPWNGEKIGMSICYEVVFPSEVAALVRQGATVLVTITNDAWYGDTSAPWQHFRAARFRAAENRRPLLRSAITGVTAFVAPDGSVLAEIGPFHEGILRARVLGERRLTLFSRAPWLVPLLSTLVALVALAWVVGYTATREKRSVQ